MKNSKAENFKTNEQKTEAFAKRITDMIGGMYEDYHLCEEDIEKYFSCVDDLTDIKKYNDYAKIKEYVDNYCNEFIKQIEQDKKIEKKGSFNYDDLFEELYVEKKFSRYNRRKNYIFQGYYIAAKTKVSISYFYYLIKNRNEEVKTIICDKMNIDKCYRMNFLDKYIDLSIILEPNQTEYNVFYSIDNTSLSNRTKNILKDNNIVDVADLLKITEKENWEETLSNLRAYYAKLGPKGLSEIEEFVKVFNAEHK